jgi:hypothetical protein
VRWITPLIGLLAAACQAPFYRYEPAPLESFVEAKDGSAIGRALVSVLSATEASKNSPSTLLLRMRLENLGSTPFQLADDLLLVSADLVPFQTVELPAHALLEISPASEATFDLRFVLAKDVSLEDLDLTSLNLRWTVTWDGGSATTSSTFMRVYPVPTYGGYPYMSYGMSIGFCSDCGGSLAFGHACY